MSAARPPPPGTARLRLREVVAGDAAFILALVTDPTWVRNIGDRGVHDLESARGYIANGPQASYAAHGFGLWCVEALASREPLGLCGLLQRSPADDVEIGFAFLPAHVGKGYAFEAAGSTLRRARDAFALARVTAIVRPHNEASVRLLRKLGFAFEGHDSRAAAGHDVARYAIAL